MLLVKEHTHYTYTLLYRNEKREVGKNVQGTARACKNSVDRFYQGEEYCIYLKQCEGIKKKSSERKVEGLESCEFPTPFNFSCLELIHQYFEEDDIDWVFSFKFVRLHQYASALYKTRDLTKDQADDSVIVSSIDKFIILKLIPLRDERNFFMTSMHILLNSVTQFILN